MSNDSDHRLDKRLLRRAFERAAVSYDAAAVLQREVGERMARRLDLVRFEPPVILDVGAGTGMSSVPLAQRYPAARVIALDIAEAMLSRARARDALRARLQAVCADMEAVPLAPASVDMVFSNLALQWSTDLEVVLSEFRRVLRPGGLLTFTTFGPDTLQELRASWERADAYVHVNAFADMHDVGDSLVRGGFAEPVMDVEHFQLTYADFGALLRDLRAIGVRNLNAGRARGMTGRQRLAAVRAAYEAFRSDGRLPASYEVIYGHAWVPAGAERTAAAPVGGMRSPLQRLRRAMQVQFRERSPKEEGGDEGDGD